MEREDDSTQEIEKNGFSAAYNMVPTGEHNTARANQTGDITTNYGGRLIPRLWTSKELLRWKKNRTRASENLHPAFIAGLGHLAQKQLGDSAETSHSPVIISTPSLDISCRSL